MTFLGWLGEAIKKPFFIRLFFIVSFPPSPKEIDIRAPTKATRGERRSLPPPPSLYIPIPKVSSFLPTPSSTQRNGIQPINMIFSQKVFISVSFPNLTTSYSVFLGYWRISPLAVVRGVGPPPPSWIFWCLAHRCACVASSSSSFSSHTSITGIGRRKEGREEGVAFIAGSLQSYRSGPGRLHHYLVSGSLTQDGFFFRRRVSNMLSCSFRPGYWRHNSSGFAFFAWQVWKQRAFLRLSLSFKSRWRGGKTFFVMTEQKKETEEEEKAKPKMSGNRSVRLAELSWSLE